MDLVLETFDAVLFDSLYAIVLPVQRLDLASNGTYSSLREAPTAAPYVAQNTWHYKAASQYWSLPPSEYAYMSEWTRDDWRRQLVTLFLITWVFGLVVYYVFATLPYIFLFDKATFNHPKYVKDQISLEIRQTNIALPVMAVFTALLFLLEVPGYSKIYDNFDEAPGMWYSYMQFPFFFMFTDFFIYGIHRALHHPLPYKHLHKPHHKWIMPTPYASHAFHPLDGYVQGLPYHIYPFIFPLQKFAYVFLFVFINIWTVLIHAGKYVADNPIINGAACHTMHHLYFNFNYGQFTTLWDRLGGSYRKPADELFQKELKMCQSTWKQQNQDVDKMITEAEGSDDRKYMPEEPKKFR